MNDELRDLLIKQIGNEDEKKVAKFLVEIGLEFVAANSMFYDELRKPTNELDLIFTYEKHTFVIEVSDNAQKDARREKRKNLAEWAIKKNWQRLAEKHELNQQNSVYLVYIDLSEKSDDGKFGIENNPQKNECINIVYEHQLMPIKNEGGIKTANEFLKLVSNSTDKNK